MNPPAFAIVSRDADAQLASWLQGIIEDRFQNKALREIPRTWTPEESSLRLVAVVILIGRDWLWSGANLQSASDLRLQTMTEVALRSRTPIFPVLLSGATMPTEASLPQSIQQLAYLQALPLQRENMALDLERLISTLEGFGQKKRMSRREVFLVAAFVVTFLLFTVWYSYVL